MDSWWGAGDWFRDDSRALHLLYALFLLLLHQFRLRSLGIRSQRLGIPAVGRKVCERSWCHGGGTSKLETTGSLPADSDAQLEEDPRVSVFRSWLFFTMDLPSEWTWLMFTWTTIISRRSLLPHSTLTTTGKSLVHLSSPFSPQTGAETHPFHPWIPAPWYLSRHRCISDQLCPTLCNPIDCSPPGFSVHEIFQARILEQVAISFFMDLPDLGITPTSLVSLALAGEFFTSWATREGPPGARHLIGSHKCWMNGWLHLYLNAKWKAFLEFFSTVVICCTSAVCIHK